MGQVRTWADSKANPTQVPALTQEPDSKSRCHLQRERCCNILSLFSQLPHLLHLCCPWRHTLFSAASGLPWRLCYHPTTITTSLPWTWTPSPDISLPSTASRSHSSIMPAFPQIPRPLTTLHDLARLHSTFQPSPYNPTHPASLQPPLSMTPPLAPTSPPFNPTSASNRSLRHTRSCRREEMMSVKSG